MVNKTWEEKYKHEVEVAKVAGEEIEMGGGGAPIFHIKIGGDKTASFGWANGSIGFDVMDEDGYAYESGQSEFDGDPTPEQEGEWMKEQLVDLRANYSKSNLMWRLKSAIMEALFDAQYDSWEEALNGLSAISQELLTDDDRQRFAESYVEGVAEEKSEAIQYANQMSDFFENLNMRKLLGKIKVK